MSAYGRKRGGTHQASGHTGDPQDSPFIFDPEFPTFCLQHTAQLARTKDAPLTPSVSSAYSVVKKTSHQPKESPSDRS